MHSCALCSNPILLLKVTSDKNSFCCHGCHAVYQILESALALDGFENHPVFQQAVKFGIISNPVLLEQLQKKDCSLEKHKWQLEIQKMWCGSCAELIKLILLKHKGISFCIVDYATDLSSIEYYPQLISKKEIEKLIKSLGYLPLELSNSINPQVPKGVYIRFLVASFCALNIMMFAYPLYAITLNFEKEGVGELFAKLSFLFSLPVIFYCAFPIYRRFYYGLKVGFLGMEALVTIGTLASFVLSVYELYLGSVKVYFDSLTVIIALVLLGKILEAKAKFSSKEMLYCLHRSLPQKARKIFHDQEKLVPVKEIKLGDLIVAHGGEKIVVDGVVERGQGACDESHMTGESLPNLKQADDVVIAGAIVQSGSIVYRVEKLAEQSTMQKMISLLESDIGQKGSHISYSDQIAKIFTPLVLFLAFVTGIFKGSLAALAVLLISCPCAIGIAAPLADSHLMMQLVHIGAIVRNRLILRWLGKETVYVFDKTGTVTEGKFQVISGLDKLTSEELAIIKSMTAYSAHPLSYALHHSIQMEKQQLTHIEEVPGKGLRAIIGQTQYFLGSPRFLEEEGFPISCPATHFTPVCFARNGTVSTLLLGDKIREEASNLHSLLPKCILLSGDYKHVVEYVAKELQFDEWRANVTPLEKKAFIEELKKAGHIVCMVGDGVNDAPAIAAAHVGVSLQTASEISIQISDILLTGSLNTIATLRSYGKKGGRILQQNLFWAYLYNCIGVLLAMAGKLSPIFSAFAMTASSLIVLFNSRRINTNS